MSPARIEDGHERGWIVPVGGAEDKGTNAAILRRFAELAGGEDAIIAVIPTASELPDTGDRYAHLFRKLGVEEAFSLPFAERADAERPDLLEALGRATGVFLTGGNQLRISTILGGTTVAKTLRRLNARGVTVGGTSAGAAILSEHMIAYGENGSTPIAGAATLTPGLGLTNRVVIDQHFRQRDRLGRLLSALCYNPFAVGIGLDENTAAFIDPHDEIHVLGSGGVTLLDPSCITHTSVASARPGDPICVTDVRLHVLTAGARYNLHTRVASPPAPRDDDDSTSDTGAQTP